jgi:hypothetical protein
MEYYAAPICFGRQNLLALAGSVLLFVATIWRRRRTHDGQSMTTHSNESLIEHRRQKTCQSRSRKYRPLSIAAR